MANQKAKTLTAGEKEILVGAMQVAIAQMQRKIKAEKHAGIRELLIKEASRQEQIKNALQTNQGEIEL